MLFNLFSSSVMGEPPHWTHLQVSHEGLQAAISKLTISADDQKSEILMVAIRKMNEQNPSSVVGHWPKTCHWVWREATRPFAKTRLLTAKAVRNDSHFRSRFCVGPRPTTNDALRAED